MSTVTAKPAETAGPTAAERCGVLAEFDSPGALLTAAERVRDAGYRNWDSHSPFPVHGIDEAMGIRPTRLPWIVFGAGVAGCLAGLGLQWWTNSTNPEHWQFLPIQFQGYSFLISGKPIFSLPANIPVIFEVTVLFAALAAVFGMLALNNLPLHAKPVLNHPRFRRATTDRFFITIDAADPKFHPQRTAALLREVGSLAVEDLHALAGSSRFPRGFAIAGMILVSLALLPPLLVAKARVSKSTEPRIHIIQDMDNQPRFQAQDANPIFADLRAARPPVAGAIARGELATDEQFESGRTATGWADTFPAQIEISAALLRRGQERYNIFCAPCHGYDGLGQGMVAQRALELDTAGWNPPTSLVGEVVTPQPHGQIFNSITNGVRTMPPYGDQIAPRDRWAIVAYVRALQRSQNARVEDVPPELRAELR